MTTTTADPIIITRTDEPALREFARGHVVGTLLITADAAIIQAVFSDVINRIRHRVSPEEDAKIGAVVGFYDEVRDVNGITVFGTVAFIHQADIELLNTYIRDFNAKLGGQ